MATTVTESQIASTIAALLGEDYNADVARADKPITDVLVSREQRRDLAASSGPVLKQTDSRR
jgi:hypothetical protein